VSAGWLGEETFGQRTWSCHVTKLATARTRHTQHAGMNSSWWQAVVHR
jgi:hypothetical protein